MPTRKKGHGRRRRMRGRGFMDFIGKANNFLKNSKLISTVIGSWRRWRSVCWPNCRRRRQTWIRSPPAPPRSGASTSRGATEGTSNAGLDRGRHCADAKVANAQEERERDLTAHCGNTSLFLIGVCSLQSDMLCHGRPREPPDNSGRIPPERVVNYTDPGLCHVDCEPVRPTSATRSGIHDCETIFHLQQFFCFIRGKHSCPTMAELGVANLINFRVPIAPLPTRLINKRLYPWKRFLQPRVHAGRAMQLRSTWT